MYVVEVAVDGERLRYRDQTAVVWCEWVVCWMEEEAFTLGWKCAGLESKETSCGISFTEAAGGASSSVNFWRCLQCGASADQKGIDDDGQTLYFGTSNPSRNLMQSLWIVRGSSSPLSAQLAPHPRAGFLAESSRRDAQKFQFTRIGRHPPSHTHCFATTARRTALANMIEIRENKLHTIRYPDWY
jgi:hypothetical protein